MHAYSRVDIDMTQCIDIDLDCRCMRMYLTIDIHYDVRRHFIHFTVYYGILNLNINSMVKLYWIYSSSYSV